MGNVYTGSQINKVTREREIDFFSFTFPIYIVIYVLDVTSFVYGTSSVRRRRRVGTSSISDLQKSFWS